MRGLLAPALAAAVLVLTPAPAQAHEPTCAELAFLDVDNHGEHVTRDYVGDPGHGQGAAKPGGPGAGEGGHLEAGIAPGASFCNEKARSWGVPRG